MKCYINFVLSDFVQQLINLTPVGLAADVLIAFGGLTIGKLHRQHVNHKNNKRD